MSGGSIMASEWNILNLKILMTINKKIQKNENGNFYLRHLKTYRLKIKIRKLNVC